MAKTIESKKAIKVTWEDVSAEEFKYANNLYIAHTGTSEFHVVFGHLAPINTTNMKVEEIPEKVSVKPVASLVINEESLEKFIEALQQNYAKYKETRGDK